MIRRHRSILSTLAALLLAAATAFPCLAATRGLTVFDASGAKVGAFTGSFALLVGVSDYRSGWPKLESVPAELDRVAQALSANGFAVDRVMNPGGEALEQAFKRFIDAHGYDKGNRLVFYFAGHGYTLDAGKKGYLVPSDAPDPRRAESDFRRKALNMSMILAWCRDMTARHALFLFDSCFSGAIFKTRDLPGTPPHIGAATGKPVRQFISAGSAGESVPARSVFAPSLVRALGGEADLTRDGYVTGTELGMYLRDKVMGYGTGQTPQYGKIKDPDLDEGDFVFQVADGTPAPPPPPAGKASLKVETEPEGGVVFVNGRKVGTAPVDVQDIPPGKVVVRAELAGNSPVEQTLDLRPGQSVYLPLVFTPAQRRSRLTVTPEPGDATVKILNIGPRYSPGMELAPGRYHVSVSRSGYEAFDRWLDLAAGQDLSVPVTLQPAPQAPAPAPPVQVAMAPAPSSPPSGGKEWTDPATGMEFVWVPQGCYQMGSNSGESDEKPVHEVCVDGLWLGKTEVTQGQWSRVMGGNPSKFQKGDDYPVEMVSWNDAQEFIKKLNSQGNGKFRLPTEAEWEYAARAGTTTARYWGENIGSNNANCDGCGSRWDNTSTAPVGSFRPNAFGLHDMLGNVWEWCEDWYDEKAYSSHARSNPLCNNSASGRRVLRGGSWGFNPGGVRSADRGRVRPDFRDNYDGFRLARLGPGRY